MIKLHKQAKEQLLKGINKVADAVKTTLGPNGRNVIYANDFNMPEITNDGVSVARRIRLKGFQHLGAELIKEVAEKTNKVAGDGTTTSVVLAQSIINGGMEFLVEGNNALQIKKDLDSAGQDIIKQLKAMAVPIKGVEEARRIATLSAEDEAIGKIVADVIYEVKKDGVITVEESPIFGLSKEIVKGLQFDKGFIASFMMTNSQRLEAVYDDAYILITDYKILAVADIVPIIDKMKLGGKKSLVVIAEEVDGQALTTIFLNWRENIFNTLAIKAPGFGDRSIEQLEDIASLTGGTLVSERTGIKLEDITIEMLGRADRVISTQEHTTIVGGKGKKKDIDDRVIQIKAQLKKDNAPYDEDVLKERLAKLTGGVAVIKVGSATEAEMMYKKAKIEDALNATRAAIEEGVVPGGGLALKACKTTNQILKKAIQEPYNIISKDTVVSNDIIDPVKVTRVALENAISVAGIFLTTEVAVINDENIRKT